VVTIRSSQLIKGAAAAGDLGETRRTRERAANDNNSISREALASGCAHECIFGYCLSVIGYQSLVAWLQAYAWRDQGKPLL